jgi:hypothetical protein
MSDAKTDAPPATPDVGFHAPALVAALLLPGLGHIVRREFTRGIASGLSILAMFFGGLLIGGIDVVDSREDRIWFFGQALVGPIALATNHLHQTHYKVIDERSRQPRSARPGELRDAKTGLALLAPTSTPTTRPVLKSIGRANELGMLIATLAGMLNLIVILDAGFPSVRPARTLRRSTPAQPNIQANIQASAQASAQASSSGGAA